MAKLKYYYGSMSSGKSTLALQMNHNFKAVGKQGILITMGERSGRPEISSRLGLSAPALLVQEDTDLFYLIADYRLPETEYIICDEIQFYTKDQIDQLGAVVDEFGIDVYCFGIAIDFTSNLFESAKRLFEIADEKKEIEVKTLCWCGRKGIMHARTVNGYMTKKGKQKLIGDVDNPSFGYEVLCRKHYCQGTTRRKALEDKKI